MGLLDWLAEKNNQNFEENQTDYKFSLERYLVNECSCGRDNLKNDYPDFYDKLRTEMGESRFNDDLLYNSEIKNVRKILIKDRNLDE